MSSAADIQVGDWIDRHLPAGWRPYARLARLDRPIGTWLLLFPGWWSLALAAAPGQLPDGTVMLLFAIGALVMRGAGCTINDIVDRDFDKQVARTATRPLASGALSLKQALVFLVLQLAVAFVILLQLEPLAIELGIGDGLGIFFVGVERARQLGPRNFRRLSGVADIDIVFELA